MSDNQFTKSGPGTANSGVQGKKPKPEVAAQFNLGGKLADGYDNASAEAKSRVRDVAEIRDSRLAQRKDSQSYWFDKNIAEEKNKLFEAYLSNPSNAPETPEARRLVQDTIAAQAEKNVTQRNENSLKYIERECEANMGEIIRLDQKGQLQTHGGHQLAHDSTHDAEHEQGQ